MNYYHAFNLLICSELPFPELLPSANLPPSTSNSHCITIKFGKVSHHGLNASISEGIYYQTTEHETWLNINKVARFLISNGTQITIDPIQDIDQDSLRLYILGSCMGALLMQRNLLILHGNAVKIDDYCVSFVGDSGAGKSTLSGAFFKRGYSILADDVCAINAECFVLPSFPQIKLWLDAANYLNIETQSLRRIRPQIEKFAVPLDQQFHQDMLRLNIIYSLHTHDKDEFKFETISGGEKLQSLQINSYRRAYLIGLKKREDQFLHCSKLAKQVNVVKITRPGHGFKLNELVDLIEKDLLNRMCPDKQPITELKNTYPELLK